MDMTQLYYFSKLAELEHLTRAAEELYISQSTLSMSISRLESELGVTLFDRVGRGIRLNAYGEAFRHGAKGALEAVNRGIGLIEQMKRTRENQIRLIAPTIMGFPGLMMELEKRAPGIQLKASQCTLSNIVPRFLNGEVDFCIIAMELTDPALEGCVLRKQEMGCAVSSASPLSSRESVTLAELADLHFTAYPPGNTQRELFTEMFASKGLFPAVTFECESFYEMLRSVAADPTGRFAATLVRKVYENHRMEGTHFLRIEDADIDADLRLYWLKEKPGATERPLVSTVREVIQEHFKNG